MSYARHQAPKRRHYILRKMFMLLVVIAAVVVGGTAYVHWHYDAQPPALNRTASAKTDLHTPDDTDNTAAGQTAAPPNECAGNTLPQNVIVSISRQHLWACADTSAQYDSAVVTGMELYPADLTPAGIYRIYGKETDLTLSGHDSTGSWNDPVSYWMPFLDNQYGAYGFHDAAWRSPSDFGDIDINAPYTAAEHGSHGCVELPLATAKWLYNWAQIGTTVTIES